MISQSTLKAALHYDPAAGVFSWLDVRRCAGGRTSVGERADDSFQNLRAATWVENCRNNVVRSDNKSGVTGVSFDARRSRWVARIKANGRYQMLGRFQTADAAIGARKAAEKFYFGAFAPQA